MVSKWEGYPDLTDICKRIELLNFIKFDDDKINEKLKIADDLIKSNSIEESQ